MLCSLGRPRVACGPQRTAEAAHFVELENMVRTLGLASRVRFAGQQSNVTAFLHASDIYCQPNTAPEAFGITFVEAQAAALPIVSSAIGGAVEIVGADCGRLVTAGDIAAIAAALRELIGDRALRQRLGHNGQKISSARCDLVSQMRRTHDVLGRATIAGAHIGAARASTS